MFKSPNVYDDPQVLQRDAESAFRQNELRKSWERFALMSHWPQYQPLSFFGLATVEMGRSNFTEARRLLELCKNLRPRAHKPIFLLGELARKSGNLSEAASLYKQALAIQPQFLPAAARLQLVSTITGERRRESALGASTPPVTRMDGTCGVVSGLRQEVRPQSDSNNTEAVWSFRIEVEDGRGGRSVVPVTLRGQSLRGSLADGDLVVVSARPSKSNAEAILLYNHVTGGLITRGRLQDGRKIVTGREERSSRVAGVVCNFMPYSERYSMSTRDRGLGVAGWSFRVKTDDNSLVPVDMRSAREIIGSLRNGDRVEILEPWHWGKTLTPRVITNLTTNTKILAIDPREKLFSRVLLQTLLAIPILLLSAMLAADAYHSPLPIFIFIAFTLLLIRRLFRRY